MTQNTKRQSYGQNAPKKLKRFNVIFRNKGCHKQFNGTSNGISVIDEDTDKCEMLVCNSSVLHYLQVSGLQIIKTGNTGNQTPIN